MKRIVKIVLLVIFIVPLGIYLFNSYEKKRYTEESEAYFQQKCEKDAGEFIYRTVENVEGLYQMRPRDPRDYFTRLRSGDLPEDPYGHTNYEARRVEALFLNPKPKNAPRYKYFESTKAPNTDRRFPTMPYLNEPVVTGEKYWRYTLFGHDENGAEIFTAEQSTNLKSSYGFTWKEIRDDRDKLLGVWEGNLIVMNLNSNEVLGIKRGFFYVNLFTKEIHLCPRDKSSTMTYDFISKVIKPIEDTNEGDK